MAKLIELTGKHAVGESKYTIVDDGDFDALNQYRWKAKPNGSHNNVYAVRNSKCSDGITRTIRMHRVIIGYEGTFDVDHINHNSLDNRRENLRVVARSINVRNQRTVTKECVCKVCGSSFCVAGKSFDLHTTYCSTQCEKTYWKRVRDAKQKPEKAAKAVVTACCSNCSAEFIKTRDWQTYCSQRCRKQQQYMRKTGSLG